MKVEQTRQIICEALQAARNPAVMCSFGKDSCALLHFIREQKPDITVIYFRGLSHATKHRFADGQVKALGLQLVEPLPLFRDVISNGKVVQLIEVFRTGGADVHFPVEAEPDFLPDKLSYCAIEKLQAPTDNTPWEYDCIFIGHRGDDVDPFWGDIGAQSEQVAHNGVTFVYPLLNWTECDIWQASREHGIAQNIARYAGDISVNNDYYPICTNCLKPTGDMKAFCPKTGLMINNIAEAAGVVKQAEVWRSRFVNLKERSHVAAN